VSGFGCVLRVMERGARGAHVFSHGDTMRTRRNQLMVSVASELSGVRLAAVFVVALWVGACAGRQRPVTQTEGTDSAESTRSVTTAESPAEMLQFDNQATAYVDVYLVGGQTQWRLGRVPPGMRMKLRVPASAVDWTMGFVQLVVIPGSQISMQAWRDPRAVVAIAQPVSDVLSQRWDFRQQDGLPLQLQATRLPGRR